MGIIKDGLLIGGIFTLAGIGSKIAEGLKAGSDSRDDGDINLFDKDKAWDSEKRDWVKIEDHPRLNK